MAQFRQPCSIEGCERDRRGHGYCSMHYQRWVKHGDPLYVRPKRIGVAKCSIDGCEKLVAARGWCAAHWSRWDRHGSPTVRLRGEVRDGKRICPRCRVDKPLSEWSNNECLQCGRERAREYPYVPKHLIEHTCSNCGKAFVGNKKNRRYCSRACRAEHKNIANWPHLHARRARLREAFVEKFDRFEIFERDGWVCGICQERIDRDLAHPNPYAASLDHVLPISRGGKHSRANSQASHWICNMRKGASITFIAEEAM